MSVMLWSKQSGYSNPDRSYWCYRSWHPCS
ncbi:hypothetical protein P879_09650 [Paragonimus westermani]|uniref:Uncharacterized protein n=1 Tax=Paragonimus westermani TaxID=34504 RepID=A0A8T0DK46_9TREM|nr:hypothetical protein P879_09650 [Paragonimus westermani]